MRDERPPGHRPGTAVCMECDWTSTGRPADVETLTDEHVRIFNHGAVYRPLIGTGRIVKKKVENIVDTL